MQEGTNINASNDSKITGANVTGMGIQTLGKTAQVAGKGLTKTGQALSKTGAAGAIVGVPLAGIGTLSNGIGKIGNNVGQTLRNNGVNDKNKQKSDVNRLKYALNKSTKGLQATTVLSGGANKIANQNQKHKPLNKSRGLIPGLNTFDNLFGSRKKETEEKASDDGGQNFRIPIKVKKGLIIAAPAFLVFIIFCAVLSSATQIYLNVITLGNADSLSSSDASKEIDNFIDKKSDKLDEEITDDDLEDTDYLGYTGIIYDENSLYSIKLQESNLVEVASKKYRKYNEADLSKLEDFYPQIKNEAKNYDEMMVYDFFIKMYNLNKYYNDFCNYSGETPLLDLPLLMATLRLQSSDMNVVFESNLDVKDRLNVLREQPVSEYAYDYDWSGYVTTPTKSTHDMEILAQHMISLQATESCVDSTGKETKTNNLKDSSIGTKTLTCSEGETYKVSEKSCVVDNDKYKEFLKEFLEKKYFINTGDNKINDIGIDGTNYKANDSAKKDGNYVSDVTYTNSNFGEVIYFNQADYYKYYYSSNPNKVEYWQNGTAATIKSHGCGPTALSIVISSLLNKNVDPIETTSKVCLKGGCSSTGSTTAGLIKVAEDYGIKVTQSSKNQDVIDALKSKKSLVIVLMGPGTFTRGGHYIVLTGSNESGQVSVSDPGSRKNTNKKWFSFNTVVEQKKDVPYMIFSR